MTVLYGSLRSFSGHEWQHMRVIQYTPLPHYSIDVQVAVTHQDILQCASKDGEKADCKLLSIDVNKLDLKDFMSN